MVRTVRTTPPLTCNSSPHTPLMFRFKPVLRSIVHHSRQYSSYTPPSARSNFLATFLGAAIGVSATSFAIQKWWGTGHNDSSPRHKSQDSRTSSIASWQDNKYGTKQDLERALPELIAVVGEDDVSTDYETARAHSYSGWATYNLDEVPFAVVSPHNTEQVSKVARICHKYRLPMIGYSGGSSLEGHIATPYGGVCVDFIHMDKVLHVRPDDLDCTLQPAVNWMDLNRHLQSNGYGLFFPVDPGPTARIGGMVNTNCSGTNCVKYGPMRQHVVNLTVVLADGTIIKTGQRPRKTSAGYNLNQLFTGSEGTLGLVTEVTLKLVPVPDRTSVAVCSFPTVRTACTAAIDVIKRGVPLHAVELMDDVQMWAINQAGLTNRSWDETPSLFFKFSGTSAHVDEQIAQTRAIASQHGNISFDFASTDQEMDDIWRARKELLWSMLALGPEGGVNYATDIAVPMSNLADLVERVKQDIDACGAFTSVLGHVGDANIHTTCIYRPEKDYEMVAQLAKNAVDHGIALEGTCTGEHGVGASKVEHLVNELGVDTILVMATLKQALDPLGLMNPGKIFTKQSIENGLLKK